jgi:ATP-binding cassette subfamily B protein
VDLHTEVRIRAALARLCRGRTSLIIAHRLATVMDCDRVVVLEQGRIVDDGAPGALLAAGGPFARLHAAGTAD